MKKEIRILMVEDNGDDALLMDYELRKSGLRFQSLRVETEADFQAALAHDPPDLILSDHGLPTFNGFTALAIARERLPDVPLIFVTGSLGEEMVLKTLKSGATDYVLKHHLSDLVPAVHRALRHAEECARRREAEEALRRSEERFRHLVEHVADYAIYLLDAAGRIATWNAGAERIEGYRADEIIGRPISILYAPEDVAAGKPQCALEKAVAQGHCQEEGWRLRKDGTRFWANVVVTPLRNEAGELYGFSRVARDMTERKNAAEELQARVRQQEVVAELGQRALAAPDVQELMAEVVGWIAQTLQLECADIFELSGEGDRLLLRASAGWTGGLAGTLSVRADESTQPGYTLKAAQPVVVTDLRTERRFVALPPHVDRGVVSGISVIVPMRQGPFGVLSVHTVRERTFKEHDIFFLQAVANVLGAALERKHAEEQISRLNTELEQRVIQRTAQLEMANKELEAFSYSVSHDLRAPLRHIDGFVHILNDSLEGNLNDASRQALKTITEAARKMGRLIDDLLAFSRMSRTELRHVPVDLNLLVEKVRQEIEADCASRSVHWAIEPLPCLCGDAEMLRQVLINLLANALKYTRTRAEARIELSSYATETETVVYVRDNGVGFDPKYAHKLFGVFQRLHSAQEFEGTGIGLAIVRRVITRHGGRTWAEGALNQGATIYFAVPKLPVHGFVGDGPAEVAPSPTVS